MILVENGKFEFLTLIHHYWYILPGIIRDMYMGEFCSFPPITLNPRPSSVLGNSTTLGWAWPSLAAKAATVALKYSYANKILIVYQL